MPVSQVSTRPWNASVFAASLRTLGLQLPQPAEAVAATVAATAVGGGPPMRLVTKPSNADGGFGVAFWEGPAHPPPVPAEARAVEIDGVGGGTASTTDGGENADLQHLTSAAPLQNCCHNMTCEVTLKIRIFS